MAGRNVKAVDNTGLPGTAVGHRRQVAAILEPEVAARLQAIRAATGWSISEIFAAAIGNLHDSKALSNVVSALRTLRREMSDVTKAD
jgi:uncharacterized protein (UPF0335 family)